MNHSSDYKAGAAIRLLLNGNPPNGTSPSECGPWAEIMTALYDAYDCGGVAAARRVFNTLVKQVPELTQLISTEPINKTRWTVAELYNEQFLAPKFIVPRILPTGMISLAGRPKVGKSWLALQIAHAVGRGGSTLEQVAVSGKVLYLALEDTPRRLKDRCQKQGIPREANITIVTEWKSLDNGGIADLVAAMHLEGYTLIIIDTFSRACGRADQLDNREMNDLLGQLHQAVQSAEAATLMVDHHRKPNYLNTDPIDDILGSTAKSAVVDAALGLYKQRGKPGATLKIAGRDVEEQELALQWDATRFCWQLLGTTEQVTAATIQGELLEALVTLGGQSTVTELAEYLGKQAGNISRELNELVAKGKVKRGERNGRQVPYLLLD